MLSLLTGVRHVSLCRVGVGGLLFRDFREDDARQQFYGVRLLFWTSENLPSSIVVTAVAGSAQSIRFLFYRSSNERALFGLTTSTLYYKAKGRLGSLLSLRMKYGLLSL